MFEKWKKALGLGEPQKPTQPPKGNPHKAPVPEKKPGFNTNQHHQNTYKGSGKPISGKRPPRKPM